MLFINAAKEIEYVANPQGDVHSMLTAMQRLKKYMPIDESRMSLTRGGMNTSIPPDLISRTACCDMFKPWDRYFDMFMDETKITQLATLYGLAIKKKHTIVQPWPYKIQNSTTKGEFDVLRASSTTGFERYMEFQRLEVTVDGRRESWVC